MNPFTDRLLIGTYTNKQRGGIYLLEFSDKGNLKIIQHVNDADNPSYLAVHPKKNGVIAANEGGGAEAKISSYSLQNDRLTLVNQVPSGGDHPCYVDFHPSGKWVAVANYTGGNMTVFPLDEQKRLGNFVHDIHHTGQGTFLKRQEKPHAHTAVFANDHLYYSDLGLDAVYAFSFHANDSHPLQASTEYPIKITPGGGPRHIAFHPKTKNLYVIEELTGHVSFFPKKDKYTKLQQRIKCSEDETSEDKGSADIHISPDGKFLYASNRAKANSLAIFSFAPNGELQLIKHVSTEGEQPRNFVIHPNGEFLLVANQRTDNVVVFRRNKNTGLLTKLSELSVPNPVCLKFV